MTMKGGNTDELYVDDGRLQMAQSLQEQHPDITTIKERWGRWQHVVNYRGFRHNKLIKKPDVFVPRGTNNYGLKLKTIKLNGHSNEVDSGYMQSSTPEDLVCPFDMEIHGRNTN